MILPDFWQVDIHNLTPGDDWRIVIPVAGAVWEPGDTARCHVRTDAQSNVIALEMSTANGRIILNAGEIVMVVARAVTAPLLPRAYVWDIEITRAGLTDTVMGGTLTLRRDVTR